MKFKLGSAWKYWTEDLDWTDPIGIFYVQLVHHSFVDSKPKHNKPLPSIRLIGDGEFRRVRLVDGATYVARFPRAHAPPLRRRLREIHQKVLLYTYTPLYAKTHRMLSFIDFKFEDSKGTVFLGNGVTFVLIIAIWNFCSCCCVWVIEQN